MSLFAFQQTCEQVFIYSEIKERFKTITGGANITTVKIALARNIKGKDARRISTK